MKANRRKANFIEVPLGDRAHRVWVGSGILGSLVEYLPAVDWQRILVVTDENVAELYLERVMKALAAQKGDVFTYVISPGERSKDIENLEGIYGFLADHYFSRWDLILALGGGVVGDLAGFAAATFKRGMDLVHLPTTLMAQVDSSIGGKTGVNLSQGKNLAGVFYQPRAVIVDTSVLATISEREILSGWAEVLKYYFVFGGTIRDILDGMRFKRKSTESRDMARVVEECARIKVGVITRDEYDRGERAFLNYGHSLGHALETLVEYNGSYSHGEAISIGMVFAASVSAASGISSPELLEEHREKLKGWGLPISLSERDIDFGEFVSVLMKDKKNIGEVRMVLLEDIGRPVIKSGIEERLLRESFLAVGG